MPKITTALVSTTLSPMTTLALRVEHLRLPHGQRKARYFILDGAVIVAEMKDLGPSTEALAWKLTASLDLLRASKQFVADHAASGYFCAGLNAAYAETVAAIQKAERGQ